MAEGRVQPSHAEPWRRCQERAWSGYEWPGLPRCLQGPWSLSQVQASWDPPAASGRHRVPECWGRVPMPAGAEPAAGQGWTPRGPRGGRMSRPTLVLGGDLASSRGRAFLWVLGSSLLGAGSPSGEGRQRSGGGVTSPGRPRSGSCRFPPVRTARRGSAARPHRGFFRRPPGPGRTSGTWLGFPSHGVFKDALRSRPLPCSAGRP